MSKTDKFLTTKQHEPSDETKPHPHTVAMKDRLPLLPTIRTRLKTGEIEPHPHPAITKDRFDGGSKVENRRMNNEFRPFEGRELVANFANEQTYHSTYKPLVNGLLILWSILSLVKTH